MPTTPSLSPAKSAAPIADPKAIRAFLFAGKAHLTLVSKVTGKRYTYEVERRNAKNKRDHFCFVRLLVGPDNGSDYRYIGGLDTLDLFGKDAMTFAPARKSEFRAASAGFWWMIHKLERDPVKLFNQAEIWHSGTCSRCHRELTDPESIATGLGPVCREKVMG